MIKKYILLDFKMCSVFMTVIFKLLKKVCSTVADYSFPPIIIRLRFFWRVVKMCSINSDFSFTVCVPTIIRDSQIFASVFIYFCSMYFEIIVLRALIKIVNYISFAGVEHYHY